MGRPKLGFHHAEKVLKYLFLSLDFSDNIVGVCVSLNIKLFLYKLVLILNPFGFLILFLFWQHCIFHCGSEELGVSFR